MLRRTCPLDHYKTVSSTRELFIWRELYKSWRSQNRKIDKPHVISRGRAKRAAITRKYAQISIPIYMGGRNQDVNFIMGGQSTNETLHIQPARLIAALFVGDDVHPSEFHRSIMQIAKELKIDVELVPLDRFVALPMGSPERKIRIGQFGNLEIYVADTLDKAVNR